MATKRKPSSQTSGNRHRGVWRVDRPGRPKPFGVQWREKVWSDAAQREITRRPSEFYADETDRERRYEEKAREKRRGESAKITREELRQWEAFKTASNGVHWTEIFSGYQNWLSHTGVKPCAVTVEDYRKSYLDACAAAVEKNEMSKDSYRHKDRVIGELAARFGHITLDHVATADVRKWLSETGHASGFTINSYRKLLFAFFNRAAKEKIIRHNPIADLERRVAITDNRGKILTPAETAQLFDVAQRREQFHPIINRLALEAFLGLRFTSAFRLVQQDVNMEERTVMLPAFKLKTGMRTGQSHFIDTRTMPGLENIWEWLALKPDLGWDLGPRQYMELKSTLFIAADVIHPRNTLRKSFCSYDLAVHRNPGRTAYLLGHTDQEELWNDYKGNASEATGRSYQSITPQNAAQVARGARRPYRSQPHTERAPQDG